MITDAELLKLVMDRFPEADTDGIVEQFSLLKVGLLQANAKLAVGDVGQQGVEEQSLSATDEAQAPKKRYTRRSLVVKPEEAIGDNAVQCCICGNAFQNLTIKHIQLHGLTVEEYVASDYEAPAQPNFSIYQVPPGPEGRDFRYRSYEELQADGLSVDRKNYQLIYSAPLDKDITLDEIYRRFNMEHPADYKGHSLSMGDIVVFRQDGKQTAYYVDEGADYRQVPEFFAQPEKQLTPDECMTGEQIQTPRGRFYMTDRSREQMEAAGYGFHHQSEDGRYLIMANGTRAFAIPAQPESHIKTAEMSTEQNYNMIDGMMNNAPSMEELEARAKAGEQISLLDVAEATKAEAKKPKQTQKTTQKQKKPSIRAQLAAAKEEQKKKPPAREKSKEMEV